MKVRKAIKLLIPSILLLLIGSGALRADCMSGFFTVWPESGPIPLQGLILVETYGTYQHWLENLQPCQLRLISEEEQICLIADQTFVGEVGRRQTLFRPDKPMLSGQIYSLAYVSPPEEPKTYATQEQEIEALQAAAWRPSPSFDKHVWVATEWDDLHPPTWNAEPQILKLNHQTFG